ncbi:MAG: FtsW/RodA/SpoVE family cell cycle protein, partial [Clostridia bacterium]|nr:FtsW/RodA/SpoVE family cell cycle protein [Clostridia bacterium]
MQERKTPTRRQVEEDTRIDWGIILSVLVLAVIGLGSIFVAANHDSSTTSVAKALISQSIWYVLGIIAVIFIMQFDAEQLWKIAPVAYGLGIQTGAKSWFAIGGFTFQPSEVMKPAFILMLGRVVVQHNTEYYEHSVKSDWELIGKLLLWTLPVAILLRLQNDFGTMLVFFAILGGIILVSGVTWEILLPLFGGASLIGILAIILVTYGRNLLMLVGFKAYQFDRIEAWLNPTAGTSGNSYQLWQS